MLMPLDEADLELERAAEAVIEQNFDDEKYTNLPLPIIYRLTPGRYTRKLVVWVTERPYSVVHPAP
jgi:hypothetical protein